MVLDVLNEMSPDAFLQELFQVLNKYHVEIAKTAVRPARETFRRSFGSAAVSTLEAGAAGDDADPHDPPAAEAASAEAAPAPAAPAPVEAPAAPVRGGGVKPRA